MKSNGYLTKKEKDMLKAELDKSAIGDRSGVVFGHPRSSAAAGSKTTAVRHD